MSTLYERLNPTSYGFLARVRPVLLVSLSPASGVLLWTGGLADWMQVILTLGVVAGVPYLMGERAADLGRRRQEALWESWGGSPAVQLLRHRQAQLNPHTQSRILERVALLCPDLDIPSLAEETEDERAADNVYRSAVDRLRVLFRGHAIVLKGNVSYGFRRNLWAIRWWGVAGSGVSLLAATGYASTRGVSGLAAATVTISILTAVGFLRASPSWVEEAGFAYASRLLEAVESSEPESGDS